MSDKSTYLRNAVLNAVFNAGSLSVATPFISLHTADPGATGASEVTGGSYVRQAGSFGAASSGAVTSDTEIEFAGMPAATVTHAGVWDASSAGNFLYRAALSTSKSPGAGDSVIIAVGDVDFSEA